MKYKQEIIKLFGNILGKEINEQECIMLLSVLGKTMEDFEKDLEIGISNGYSLEQQLEIMNKLLPFNK